MAAWAAMIDWYGRLMRGEKLPPPAKFEGRPSNWKDVPCPGCGLMGPHYTKCIGCDTKMPWRKIDQ